MLIVLCQYVQARIKKHDTTIRRRVYFSIKGNNVFTSNSIGNFALLLDLRMMFLFIWKLAKLTYKIIIGIVIFYVNVWFYLANLDVNKNFDYYNMISIYFCLCWNFICIYSELLLLLLLWKIYILDVYIWLSNYYSIRNRFPFIPLPQGDLEILQ